MFTLGTALILALAYFLLCAVSSAFRRLSLMRIRYNTIDEYVNAAQRIKKQLDATERFIALKICSTYFRHFYAHHQELEIICVLLPPMVCIALVADCWRSGAGSRLRVQNEGCSSTLSSY